MQGIKTGEFGLNVVDDAMREEFKLDGRATYRFDVYKPKLGADGKVVMNDKKIVYNGSKMTVFTDKTGKPVEVIHEVGKDGTIVDRKKVNGYTNADTKPHERGHIFSFQEGLGDNCIGDSPLNIIPQSTPVNSPRISQFEAYRSRECKGKKVTTDINIDDPPGYVRVRVEGTGIDVRYNPLSKIADKWPKDWFMPENAGEIYD